MYGMKWFAILIFAGCLLLFSAIFLSCSVYDKIRDLNGQVSMNKVSISLKENNKLNGGYFSLEDMEYLKKFLNTEVIAYAAQENSLVSYETNILKVGVAGINELAPMFENIRIIKGSFFSEADCREKSRVTVIDDDTAWKLFNNDNVLGCNVDIFGSQFKIIGIIKSDRSIIGKLTVDGSVKAYIPIQTYLDINNDSGIFYIQYKTNSESITGKNTDDIIAALASMGKDPANYNLTDYNVKRAVMEQKPGLLLFFMGLFVILAILVYIITYIKKTILEIRNQCKTDYFANVAGAYRYKILKILILLILAGLAPVIIWRLIRFNAFISPDLIPDDFTDVSYYINLFMRKVSQAFSTDVYTVPFQETESNTAEAVLNWVFYTGCFAGLLFFYTGLSWIRSMNITVGKALLVCGGFLTADLGIFVLLASIAGLPNVIDLKGIIIFWSFVFTNLLLFITEGKETIKGIESQELLPNSRINYER